MGSRTRLPQTFTQTKLTSVYVVTWSQLLLRNLEMLILSVSLVSMVVASSSIMTSLIIPLLTWQVEPNVDVAVIRNFIVA